MITFILLKNNGTVQELLEQIDVWFDVKIQIERNCAAKPVITSII